ncbi:hypothetical protein DFH09DRAFT_1173089 [Mycena vulgaris]|nr:hypothetical protein DFH09DRAFT_1173089 [Mycena vulgaris]
MLSLGGRCELSILCLPATSPNDMNVIVDDRDTRIQYTPPGGWTSGGTPAEYMMTTSTSKLEGATAIFTFEGTSVGVYGTVGPGNGSSMAFSIDGSSVGYYAAPAVNAPIYHEAFWSSEALPNGTHTLIIIQTSSTQSYIIFLDYFIYTTTALTAETKLFIDDDDNTHVEYSPGWDALNLDQCFHHTTHACQSDRCWVSVTFEGTFVSLTGPIQFGPDGKGFNASAVIDVGSPVFIANFIQQPRTTTYNNELFSSSVPPGNHTIVITVFDGQPFYLDYLLVGVGSTAATSTIATPTASASIFPSATDSPPLENPPALTSPHLAAAVGGAAGALAMLAMLAVLMWRRKAGKPGPRSFLSCGILRSTDRPNPRAIDPFLLWPTSNLNHVTPPPPKYTQRVH